MRRTRKPAARPGDPRRPSRPAILAWLARRQDFERTPPAGGAAFGLARVRRLLAAVGSPQERLRVVHVAGTKGKGSTVTMLAEILAAAGHRVGRYTSPHVHRLEERICVDGRPIAAADLAAAFATVIPAVETLDRAAARRCGRGPTWFEAVTAAALVHFVRAGVDVVVLETGLGGRLDATNVCRPLVSVITSISLDHMNLLGGTIVRIAAEKAGIVKRGRPVISGATHPAARRVIEATAKRRRAPLLELGSDFRVTWRAADDRDPLAGGTVEIEPPARLAAAPIRATLAMAGRHQADNAALAAVAALELDAQGIRVPGRAIARGLAQARLPARIELVSRAPTVVIDAAHNVASMRSLVETLGPLVGGRRRVLVFAASADKQVEEMLAEAAGRFDDVVVTRYASSSRGAAVERLVAACRAAGLPEPLVAATPAEALAVARSRAGRRGLVCVAGSFFLAAEVRGRR
ncbi:MAG: bifunctional folylpolyglutamate synthase/dihydrofolate synthase [Planctomycetaceae bacterium]